MPSAPHDYYLSFAKREQVAKDTDSFYFYRNGIDMDYLPGQYMRMTLNLDYTDERGNSRFFTIASSPTETRNLMITTKLVQSAFKKSLFTLQKGTNIQFFGPQGGFYLQENIPNYVFLAGGLGITPFRSMIKYIVDKKLPISVTLFASFSTPEEIIFYDELSEITKYHTNIRVIYTITHLGESIIKWKGEVAHISSNLIKKYVPNITQQKFLIVGSWEFIASVEEIVSSMGISNDQIQIENFTGY